MSSSTGYIRGIKMIFLTRSDDHDRDCLFLIAPAPARRVRVRGRVQQLGTKGNTRDNLADRNREEQR